MKKKLLAVMLSLCMAVSLMPTAVLAAEGDVAQVGDATYSTLQEAFAAAQSGQEIQLLTDITLDTWINVTKTVTLDLNGHDITSNGPVFSMNTDGIVFTIQDETNQGSIQSTTQKYDNVIEVYKGELVVESGQFSHYGYVIYVCQNGTATVKGGTLESEMASVLSTNGNAEGNEDYSGNAVMNVEGGTLTSEKDVTIYVPAGTLNVSGGEIEGVTAIYSKSGTTTITGGTIKSEGAKADFTHSGNGCVATGDAMVIEACGYPNGEPVVRVSGGEFTSTNGSAVAYYQYEDNVAQEISISGGTFSSDVRDYVATGYEAVKGETTNTWTVGPKTDGMEATTASEGTTSSGSIGGTFTPDQQSTGNSEENNGTVDATDSTLDINVTTGDSGTANTNIKETTVTIEPATLTSVSKATENQVTSVSIATDVGTVTLDKDAWDTITENATTGGTTAQVTLSIENVTENEDTENNTATYEITATANGKAVFDAETATEGTVTITVPAPTGVTQDNVHVYYLGPNGAEEIEAIVGGTENDQTVSWDVSHFSTYYVTADEQEASVTVTKDGAATTTPYETFADALKAITNADGEVAINLLSDVTLSSVTDDSKLEIPSGKTVTIVGKGHTISATWTGDTDSGTNQNHPILDVKGDLTLDNVILDFHGKDDGTDANPAHNDGDGIMLSTGSKLTLTDGTVVNLDNLYCGFIMGDKPELVVNNATLNVSNITANGSNGGKWEIKNGSNVSFTNIGNHALSTETVSIENSKVTVDEAGYLGIYGSEITLTNADVSVTNSATAAGLATASNGAYNGKGAVQLKGADDDGTQPKLTITNSILTLTGNGNGAASDEQTIYVGNATVDIDNDSNVYAQIKSADGATTQYYTVAFKNENGEDWSKIVKSTQSAPGTITLPDLPDQGYNHFVGWRDQDGKEYKGNTEVTNITKDMTFTAVWTYIPPANPNYQIAIGDFANGTVTADPSAAKAGATVTLTATPDEGYAVGSITVTDRFGDAVAVTEQADGTYTFVMPDGQVTVNATFVASEEPAPAEPFTDVDENDWFYDEVVYVYENGLMNGVENNQFAPNTATNRAMLATILYRLAGEPDVSGDLPFTDVAAGQWYTDAVLWAAQNGIVNGLDEGTFAPMNTLTREQLVTMLYRYAEAEGYDVSAAADLSGYPDAGKVQPYAQEAMSWAVAEGIVAGMEDGTLNPAGNATRAQIATILMRFCEGVLA